VTPVYCLLRQPISDEPISDFMSCGTDITHTWIGTETLKKGSLAVREPIKFIKVYINNVHLKINFGRKLYISHTMQRFTAQYAQNVS